MAFLSKGPWRDCIVLCGQANLSMWPRHKARKLGGLSHWSFANIKHNMHMHIERQTCSASLYLSEGGQDED